MAQFIDDDQCDGHLNVVKAKYEWVITKFCSSCKEVGESFNSPVFSTGGSGIKYKWQMKLYPKSETDINKNFISFFLRSCNRLPVTAHFELTLLNHMKEKIKTQKTDKKVAFTTDKPSWGFVKFLNRKDLLKDKTWDTNDGKLVLLCEIIVGETLDTIQESEKQQTFDVPEITYRLEEFDNLGKLLNNDSYSDVTLQVKGKEFHAHRTILANRSPVFAAMLMHNMKEKHENVVEIEDIDDKVFEEALQFMYTGKVDEIKKFANDLLVLADKYDIVGLKAMCERTLCKSLNSKNALECLNLADLHGAKKLRAESINFVVSNAKQIAQESGFELLRPNLLCEVTSALALQEKK